MKKKNIEIEKEINLLKNSLDDEIGRIERILMKKADVADFNELKSGLASKPDTETVADHLVELKSNFTSELEHVKTAFERSTSHVEEAVKAEIAGATSRLLTAQSEMQKLKEHSQTLIEDRKKEVDETNRNFKTVTCKLGQQEDLHREVSALRKEIDLTQQKKCERKEFTEFKISLNTALEAKTDVDEVQKALSDMKTETARRIIELNDSMSRQVQLLEEEFYGKLSAKANLGDLNSALEQKVDKRIILPMVEQKSSVVDIESIKSKLSTLQKDIINKAGAKELEAYGIHTRESIEEVKRELALKAYIKDVCTLVDVKANVEDVNRGLESLSRELSRKSNAEELSLALADQSRINEALCAENCVGRWIWKSGCLRSGFAIPWEIQSVNTCPDNFLWDKDKTSVLTVAPGLYEVTLGFFASKKPAVQILVNGEPVLTPVNSSSYVIHHSSGKKKKKKSTLR
eukprot:TRINITY_DN31211_c0_g1_i1.p1 TRINITY_DN31211_c0_g1~~TRINITY_DN31211_c0_g1_i1.p1  ORF type:complete len:460 (-),score=93.52 TRINITY_DN31211_c0_g1_i1:3-1382(-)